tara:strand:+ start:14632 stop:16017 length:1386 start_codon:yes stop_codon:yes gene_type:complete
MYKEKKMSLISINPSTGQTIEKFSEITEEKILNNIKKGEKSFSKWRTTDLQYRSKLFNRVAEILNSNSEKYAELITNEMGKPIKEARSEIEKSAWVCNYFSENAAKFLKSNLVETDATKSYITFLPLGVILGIMPWNFPFWQVFRFATPTLMAGNVCLLKHASNVTRCSLTIENIFRDAGFPDGCFISLLLNNKQVSKIIDNPLVKAISITGSTSAGKAVASRAGANLKKTVLELGGSDPYIVLKDADLDEAISACVQAKLINSGQSCVAPKRYIIEEPIYKIFQEKLVSAMQKRIVGNPIDELIDIGPIARRDLRETLHNQIIKSINAGAKCLLGGKIPSGPGFFYPITILSDVRKGMVAYEEELFGPVACIIPVKNKVQALKVANDTSFGLGSAIFTSNIDEGEKIARDSIEAGSVFVNDFVRSDPRLPFGGIKESGYGRELSSFGIREFVNIKTVYIK